MATPADPVVSPADTIRQAGEYIATAVDGGPSDFEWLIRVFDAAYALLAVEERDKAALVQAGIVLEVLALQIKAKPYREATAKFDYTPVRAAGEGDTANG